MKKTITWILLADTGRARVVSNDGPGHGLVEVPDCSFESLGKGDKDLGTDKPGRAFDSAGAGRHAIEPHTAPGEVESKAFVDLIVQKLDEAAKAKRFDRLVLSAAPHALGLLRAALPKSLAAKVTGELAKDLTKTPLLELPKHFKDLLLV